MRELQCEQCADRFGILFVRDILAPQLTQQQLDNELADLVDIKRRVQALETERRDGGFGERLASGTEWSRVEVCAALLKSLDREYRDLLEKPGAHESILRRFQERCSMVRGRGARVEENGGFEGVTEGLDPRGFLQVRTAEGLRTVLSGTVKLM